MRKGLVGTLQLCSSKSDQRYICSGSNYIRHAFAILIIQEVFRTAGKELSETVKVLVILHIILEGMNQREAAAAAGISLESANKIWREFCELVTMNGLIPTVESMNLPNAVDLADLAKEMRRHHVTPQQCNQVLPLVVIFRNLKLDPHLIPDLLESALQLGGQDFPRDEYASTLARIRRREKETGLTIQEVDRAHESATAEVARLRADKARFQTEISEQQNTLTSLRNQSAALTVEVQGKQRRVSALDARVASEGTTLQELAAYADDKQYLAKLGFDIRNVNSARSILGSFAAMSYNPSLIINAINSIGNLQVMLGNLQRAFGENQKEVLTILKAKETLQNEVQKLQDEKKIEESRVEQVKRDADSKIAEIKRNFNDKLNEAQTTEAHLAEYVADREGLQKLGVKV